MNIAYSPEYFQLEKSSATSLDISIETNLAEGCGRNSNKDFARFLEIAYASANEVECLIILSTDLKLITEENSNALYGTLEEIKKMLYAFIQKLRTEDCRLRTKSAL